SFRAGKTLRIKSLIPGPLGSPKKNRKNSLFSLDLFKKIRQSFGHRDFSPATLVGKKMAKAISIANMIGAFRATISRAYPYLPLPLHLLLHAGGRRVTSVLGGARFI
ncbi:hypothetical protein, partial [Roseibium sp. RKSG952]|uniref:hypothetical protein n=1 Tax=Roseibium sp. RKSG952 TaxID=2529384 RepID=UPI001AD900F5